MSASLSSPPRLCAHFGSCGGCASQDVPYEDQLKRKAARSSSALGRDVAITPSPDIWFYRNKMEFSFGDVYPPDPKLPPLRLGLKPKGRWYEVLDLKECFLLSPETGALLASVRAWALENGLAPYNSHKHTGLLRHLVVREGKNTGERLVLLVAAPGEVPRDSFLKAVHAAYPATTVLRGVNAGIADTAHCESMEVWEGPGRITETLSFGERAVRFNISPQSFFQTNTGGAQSLYGILRSWLSKIRPERTLDLYCGGGGIALSVADVCGSVLGVEQNPAAVADAKENAGANAIANARFRAGSVEANLPEILAQGLPDGVVVDPPRSGLHPKALEALFNLSCPSLIYVSCNPEALKRDWGVLKALYEIEEARAVDLFPHTEHVETAVWLRRA